MSLNNRILIRDTYSVGGGVVDRRSETTHRGSLVWASGATRETMISETEMTQPVAEA